MILTPFAGIKMPESITPIGTPCVSPATFRRMRPQPLTFFGAMGLAPSQGLGPKDFQDHPPLPVATIDVPLPALPVAAPKKLSEAFLSEGSQIKFHRADLQPIKSLGAGAGGNVTLVQHLTTGLYLARKVSPSSSI